MRAFLFALAIAAVAVVGGFFGDHPGAVAIDWLGWRIETSMGVLVGATLFAVLGFFLLLRLLLGLFRAPRRWLAARHRRRRREGYRALLEGLTAVAAGDAEAAARLARRADLLLSGAPQTLLLSAQVARLQSDAPAAERTLRLLLEQPQSELFALRGLFEKALAEGNRQAAKELLLRARALRPGAPWITRSLFALETAEGLWQEAERTLGKSPARGAFQPEEARHYRGVLLYELSRQAENAGERRRALALAASAETFSPDLAPLAAHHARLLLAQGRAKAAARVVENAWLRAPQPELSRLYGTIFAGEEPLLRWKSFARLAGQNPQARESAIALAEAALAAGLWGEARRSLEQALLSPPCPEASLPAPGLRARASLSIETEARPDPNANASHFDGFASGPQGPRATARICLLMAALEEGEYGEEARAREWREKALSAAPDPLYVCADCGGESRDWHALCPSCGGFDVLFWRTPRRAETLPPRLPAIPAAPKAAISAPSHPSPLPDLRQAAEIEGGG